MIMSCSKGIYIMLSKCSHCLAHLQARGYTLSKRGKNFCEEKERIETERERENTGKERERERETIEI